jgi:hypothetical protein
VLGLLCPVGKERQLVSAAGGRGGTSDLCPPEFKERGGRTETSDRDLAPLEAAAHPPALGILLGPPPALCVVGRVRSSQAEALPPLAPVPAKRARTWGDAVRGAERSALGSCASSCRTLGSGVYAVRSDYRGRGEGDARVGEREADEVVILGVSVVDELLDDRLWGLKPGLGLPGWRGERDRRERDVQGELAAAGRRGRVQRAGDAGEAEGREARRSPSGASGGETSCQLRPSRREHRPRRTGTRSISGRVSVGERCLSLGDDAGGRS